MTKEAWCQHIESISGLVRPSRGGDFRQWRNFIASHNKTGCVECKQRAKTAKANATRKKPGFRHGIVRTDKSTRCSIRSRLLGIRPQVIVFTKCVSALC